MESPADFQALQERVRKALVSTVKYTNRITAEDLSFHRTVNPDVAHQLDETTARVLDISNRLLRSAAKACNVKTPRLEDVEDIDMNWRGVIDVVDTMLEKADTVLDEYTGIIKRKEPPTADSEPAKKKSKPMTQVIRNAAIPKPQLTFDWKPDNFPQTPWRPLITRKPHAQMALDQSLRPVTSADGTTAYSHPYATEIRNMRYPSRAYEKAEPIPYQPVSSTSATYVDTFEGVLDMLEHLKKAKEIAVDLEHHDYRTYTGIVCLMQISTREKDWIVDTLQPWRHKLEILNEAFADPEIIKVFHGAHMDMIWLQRDLGLYVNGLFDTYFACELLYSGRSLAFLLSKFADFEADKAYQLADWRIRPLPEEMLYYARSDTHYLLYIYDNVRNDLVAASDRSNPDTDFIARALQKSRELSLSRHEHPGCDEQTGAGTRGWQNYILKHSHLAFNSEQFAVFRAIWEWRDQTARKEDENPSFILAQGPITEAAKFNPQDGKALHSLLPMHAPIARYRVDEIWNRIKDTKAQNGPSLLQFLSSVTSGENEPKGGGWPAKRSTALPPVDGDVTTGSMDQSKLFGAMSISTRWEASRRQTAEKPSDHVPFPWQKFVEEGSDALEYTEEQLTTASNGAAAAPTPAKPPTAPATEDADAEFTIRRGTKRRAAEPQLEEVADEEDEDTSSDGSDSSDEEERLPNQTEKGDAQDENPAEDGIIRITDDNKPMTLYQKGDKTKKEKAKGITRREKEQEQARRSEAKAARQARNEEKKRLRQAAKEQSAASAPFDYSKAASVMHSKPSNGPTGGKKEDRKNVFDPYGKGMEEDGLKGARKAPPIRGEKSATFKK